MSEKENENEELVASFWKNNINELYKQLQEYYSYGFGASEIIFDDKTGLPVELYQILLKLLPLNKKLTRTEVIAIMQSMKSWENLQLK